MCAARRRSARRQMPAGFLDTTQRGRRLARADRLRQCLAQVDGPCGSGRLRRAGHVRRHLRLREPFLRERLGTSS